MGATSVRLAVLQRQLTSGESLTPLQQWMTHDNAQLRMEMLEFLKVC
jgi:hypothetical protein